MLRNIEAKGREGAVGEYFHTHSDAQWDAQMKAGKKELGQMLRTYVDTRSCKDSNNAVVLFGGNCPVSEWVAQASTSIKTEESP